MIYSNQALAFIAAALFSTGVLVESFDPMPQIRAACELGVSFVLVGVGVGVFIFAFVLS